MQMLCLLTYPVYDNMFMIHLQSKMKCIAKNYTYRSSLTFFDLIKSLFYILKLKLCKTMLHIHKR